MPIHIIRFEKRGRPRWGVLERDRIRPIDGEGEIATTGELLRRPRGEILSAATGESTDLASVKLLSPVTANQQFICLGANYRSHMIESGIDPDAKGFNMVFRKASSSMVAADGELIVPPHVTLMDYEIELGLVLGRDVTAGTAVTDANLHELVAGITIVNDYSARDVQIPQMQFYKGKSYRTFGPVGPSICLLDASEMHYLKALRLDLTVNGAKRQSASTEELVFGPAETLTELSGLQDLFAGDLIATGTPSGCGLRLPPPIVQRLASLLPEATRWKLFVNGQKRSGRYLKAGDLVESRIRSADGVIDLGVQRNRVVTSRA